MQLLGGWGGLALALVLAITFSIRALRTRTTPSPEARTTVRFDETGVACFFPEEAVSRVRWDEIVEVRIRTTSLGPWVPDVFWEIQGRDGSRVIVYPIGATGEQAVLGALAHRLAGFNWDRVAEAMASASDRVFVIWTRGAVTRQMPPA